MDWILTGNNTNLWLHLVRWNLPDLPDRAEGGNSHADKDTCLGCLLIGLTNRERGCKNEERMLML